MNKIKIVDDIISDVKLDDSISLEEVPKNEFFDVTSICLTINKDSDLRIEYSTRKATKLDVKIKINPGVRLNLEEYRYGKNFKIRYQLNLLEDSTANVYKFYDVSGIKEMNIITLNGKNSSIDYNFKTISTGFEKYNLTIYHNAPYTNSFIKNSGVNINKGNLQFNVSSFAGIGNKECNINQASRIINLTDNKCQINPNLFIDEYDVSANHSALIGKFSDEEMFYLQSRGIDEKTAHNLLINGFLTSNMPDILSKKITKNINKFQLIYEVDNYLFSHAGIYKEWMELCSFNLDNLKDFNEIITNNYPSLSCTGFYRGGYHPVGSCIWADIRESLKHELYTDKIQIVGHTQLEKDPYITDKISCLDCRECFILNTETNEIKEVSKTFNLEVES